MKTFEYAAITLDPDQSVGDKVYNLTQLGTKGYELVAMIPSVDGVECFFKKEYDTVAEQAKEQLDKTLSALKGAVGSFGGFGQQ